MGSNYSKYKYCNVCKKQVVKYLIKNYNPKWCNICKDDTAWVPCSEEKAHYKIKENGTTIIKTVS